MLRFALRRSGTALLLLFIVLTSTFFLLQIAPGDPTLFFESPGTTEEDRARLRAYYGLDKPIAVQYLTWLGEVLRGNWGTSIVHQKSAVSVLAEKLSNTLVLVLAVLVIEYGLGVALGVAAASRQGSALDYHIRTLSLLFYAVPIFWLGMVLIDLFAVRAQLFPVGQMSSDAASGWPWHRRLADVLYHLVLPATALGLRRSAVVVRFVRNGLLEILSQDFIRTARALGLGERRILWIHALKNSLGPLIHRFGFTLPGLLSGTIVVEVVFSWPGIGRVTINALTQRDYPLVLAATGLAGVVVVLSTLLADLLHATVDPRARVS